MGSALRSKGLAAGVAAALVPSALLFGFTVDDALIPARYAHHLATGKGYVFNPGGPVTDGVTPLGYAYLLAPFAGQGSLAALHAAKLMGAAAWVLSAGLLGLAVDRSGGARARWLAIVMIALSVPLGAWSGAGLETGIVIALVTLSASLRSLGRAELAAALFAGLAAALRPELVVLAVILGVPRGARSPSIPALGLDHALRLALAAGPFLAVATVRLLLFGKAAPLAAYAKPSTLGLGATYAAACFVLTGAVALVAPLSFRRLGRVAKWLVIAVVAHFFAIAFAGGDWMPLARLSVPAIPVMAIAVAHLACVADVRATIARAVLSTAGQLYLGVNHGPTAAGVMDDRLALIEAARPALADAQVIAAVDIGWVGAAAPHATIVDLAGVTDPVVAAFQGAHTTKRIPDAFLDERGVDAVVLGMRPGVELLQSWTETRFAHGVERWIALGPGFGDAFEPAAQTPPPLKYVILSRRRASQ
jgi:hypothetical protein